MSDPIAEKAREILTQEELEAMDRSLGRGWAKNGKHQVDILRDCVSRLLRSQDSEAFTRGKIEGLDEAADRCLEDDAFPQDWMRARVRELRQQSQKPQEKL